MKDRLRRRMSKGSLLVTTVVLLSVSFGIIMVLPENARATTRYVGGGGPGNYTTIQAAIDVASAGDTIFVYNGTYYERVTVHRTLSVVGEDKNNTRIDGGGIGDVIHVSADWVNVTGFTVVNSGSNAGDSGVELNSVHDCRLEGNEIESNSRHGIRLDSATNNTVTGNNLSDNGRGIALYYSPDNTFTSNNISRNSVGIQLESSARNNLTGNNLTANEDGMFLIGSNESRIYDNTLARSRWRGIVVASSTNSNLANNIMTRNGILLYGDVLEHWNTHTINTSNTVNGKPVYYWKDTVGGSIPADAGEAILANCTGVVLDNLSVNDGSLGIELGFSSNNVITNNNASSNGWNGIRLAHSHDNTIGNNTIRQNNMSGIELFVSYNNTIERNDVTQKNWYAGILLRSSGSNNVSGNNVSDNQWGIFLEYTGNNTIIANNVSANRKRGLLLIDSDNNTIAGNIVSGNGEEGFALMSSDRNVIVNNSVDSNVGAGVYVFVSQENEIVDNHVSGNRHGIWLYQSSNNTCERNNVSDNIWGFLVFSGANSNTINNNTASSGDTGISVGSSVNNTISNNTLTFNYEGLSMGASSYNMLIGNNASDNNGYGINLWGSDGNAVTDNHVSDNFWAGIYLNSTDNTTVSGNTVSGNLNGILMISSSANTIANNTASYNKDGIYVYWGSYANTIVNNTVSLNSDYAIVLSMNVNNTLRNNTMIENGAFVSGMSIEYWNNHTIDTTNTVNGKPVYYWKNVSGGTIPSGAGQVILANCTNVVVENQNVSNGSVGMELGFSDNNTISNNTAYSNNMDGFYILYSDNNTVSNNTASDSVTGFYIRLSENNTIAHNTASGDSKGIHLTQSDNNTVRRNTVSDNLDGIAVSSSSNNVITNNTVSSNDIQGFYVSSSDNNLLYHNNIINNTVQAYEEWGNNQWDNGYPSGGNYWSDYVGPDLFSGPNQNVPGSDGIGDVPHAIQEANQDRYPLMQPAGAYPRPPLAVQAVLSGGNVENITLSWSLSPDDGTGQMSVIGYDVYRGTTYDFRGLGYALVASLPNGTISYVDSMAGEGDPDTYFYRICAVDTGNNRSWAANQAGKFTRPLGKGLSLLSVPLIQSNESIERVLQTLSFDRAWTYDSLSQEWKSYMRSKTYSTLDRVNHTVGIWLSVTDDSNLTVAGVVPAQTTIHLYEGWNLVSYPSFNSSYTVYDLKMDTGAVRVEGYDPAPPYFLRVLGDGEMLQTGYGYWIMVGADTTWTVNIQ